MAAQRPLVILRNVVPPLVKWRFFEMVAQIDVARTVIYVNVNTNRFALQTELQSITTSQRLLQCNRVPAGLGVAPTLVRTADGGHFKGLQTCGSIWSCPVCSSGIRAERSLAINAQIAGARAKHKEVLLVTYTIQHNAGQSLAELNKALTKAFSATKQGRRGQSITADFGVEHTIRSLEVKYGENGWHPHLHVNYVLKSWLPEYKRVEMRGRLSDVYIASLERQGFSAAKGIGVDLRLCVKADYLLDMKEDSVAADNVGFELASANTKMPKHNTLGTFEDALKNGYHFHAFEIGRFGAAGSVKALRLWKEYEEAMKGQRALVYSQGAELALNAIAIEQEVEEMEEKPTVEIVMEPWLVKAIALDGIGLREYVLWCPLSTYEDTESATEELHRLAYDYCMNRQYDAVTTNFYGMVAPL